MSESQNKCTICGVDLGECNPRQLCCKTYCPNDPIEMLPETSELIQSPTQNETTENTQKQTGTTQNK